MAPPLRADARRNRELVLTAARALFAERGLSVTVQEIARSAGVGTGTVSRHFPTKEDLFEAILRRGIDELLVYSEATREKEAPGPAFFAVIDAIVRAGAADRGLAERLKTGMAESHRERLGTSVQALCDQLEAVFANAQRAGAVRDDLDLADVEALLEACMSRPESVDAMLDAVSNGLKSM